MKTTRLLMLIATVLLLASSGYTVEKEKKDAKSVAPPKSQVQPKAKMDSTRKGAVKRFDEFVDKNRNGIDDRKENLTKKAPEKQTEKKEEKKDEKKDTTGAK